MPKKKPADTLHKPTGTGRARIRIDGKDHYLRAFGSPESRERYLDLISERVVNKNRFVALKGQTMSAQGNALGMRSQPNRSPEGAK